MTFIQKNSYLAAFFLLVLLVSIYTIFSYNSNEATTSQVEVKEGDTLWTLAESFSGDIPHHEWIEEIMQQNGLETPKIVVGQSIKIPSDQLKYAPDETVKLAGDAE
ncbi:Cell division suppressor protein YneA [Planococcus massiliensis]|uniref:Cell division suppressor protein YneA n=1 Tax=Planococcus massiliensis TaxID=1499687 RepID=A0A098EL56_9BACL|nr:LysM peptidoglycan-binding domain-containing protein [Planococcus massiliensis]CEG22530.1 Cell division suppressor protein YneA [Planococcus massiliensis]